MDPDLPAQRFRFHRSIPHSLHQRLDAVANITRVQGELVGEVLVERANGNTGLQRHGPCCQLVPTVALPNPNKGFE